MDCFLICFQAGPDPSSRARSTAAASAAGDSFETRSPSAPSLDKSTQILPDDPDLFDFDEEVTIVLDAMVSKTVELRFHTISY